jgi:23S rRNA (uracil1939-C5)-methyltransferase
MRNTRDPSSSPSTLEFDVEVEKLVYGGNGLGRHEGKVVFVPYTAPGDLASVRPIEQKKKYVRAEVTGMRRPGPRRVEPPCPHFLRCGGCQWQHLEYGLQVDAKRDILAGLFAHHFPATRTLPIAMKASPRPYGYRSRARVQTRSISNQVSVGFFRHRSHDVQDIDECPLLIASLNHALKEVRGLCQSGALPAGGEWELAGTVEGDFAFAEVDAAPGTQGKTSPGVLFKSAGAFRYATTPAVFFQANEFMLEDLIATVLEDVPAGSAALDLYAGAGFFTLPLAGRFQAVTAVESNPRAHQLCVNNGSRAGLANIRALCADVRAWMRAAGSVTAPVFDLILLDPPRSGAEAEVIQTIAGWAPEVIVYVSCDPQTLVRDLALIPAREYRIERIIGLDLFPQTYHFETVAVLKRS